MIADDSRSEFTSLARQQYGLSTVCGRWARLVARVLLASVPVGTGSGLPVARLRILKRDGSAGVTLSLVHRGDQAQVPTCPQGRLNLGDGLPAVGRASYGASA